MAQSWKKSSPHDVALLYAPTDDGKGMRVLRSRGGAVEVGEVRPTKDGQPIHSGEVVRLTQRADAPCVCDVEVLYEAPLRDDVAGREAAPVAEVSGRPAQVATDDYRENWDRTFGSTQRRTKRDSSLN
ncbi:MAG TPA: hypothetical protein VJT73_04565 [Polyangiaceae bacterium]|nr:hypothetical protein [Polyangiaceae bacterium]